MSNIYYIIVIIDQFIAPNRRAIDLILFVWDYPAHFRVFPWYWDFTITDEKL